MKPFSLSFLALAGCLASLPASAQVVEMNVGHVLTTASHYHAAASKLAEVAAAKSNGQIKITVFPGAQLGGEVKQIQSVRTGTQDIVVTGEAPLENTAKDFTVFSFPYLFNSVAQANGVLQGPIGREMLDLLPRYNLQGLGFISALERNIFTNGKIIKSAADMKGLKIRVIQVTSRPTKPLEPNRLRWRTPSCMLPFKTAPSTPPKIRPTSSCRIALSRSPRPTFWQR